VHIFLGGHLLEASSSSQHFIALSTAESEFYGIIRGTACGLQLRELLLEMSLEMKVRVRTDSSAAKGVVKRSGSGKMKHLAAKDLWIQEVVRKGVVDVVTIDTLHNTSDLGTKCHPERRQQDLLRMLPIAVGNGLSPTSVRKGLFLSLLASAGEATSQGQEGRNDEDHFYAMSYIVIGMIMFVVSFVLGIMTLRFHDWITKPVLTTRHVFTQCDLYSEELPELLKLTVVQLKALSLKADVRPGHGATKEAMAALILRKRESCT
jgi:hypothetical protein